MYYVALFYLVVQVIFGTTPGNEYSNVYEILEANNLTMFTQYVDKAGLKDTLTNLKSELTIIAPTDSAFTELNEKTKELFNTDEEYISYFINYHILKGKIPRETLIDENLYHTLQPIDVRANLYKNPHNESSLQFATFNGIIPSGDEMFAKNGIVNIVDYALVPIPSDTLFNTLKIVENVTLTKFYDKLMETGIYKELNEGGPFTVFAPINKAFDDAPVKPEFTKEYLYNYIVPGTYFSSGIFPTQILTAKNNFKLNITNPNEGYEYFANEANIFIPDYTAFNGVIYVIDKLL